MESLALQEFSQQEKEKLLIKVEQDKLEKLEEQKEHMDLLQIERREMKDLMESLEKKFESEKTVFMEKTNQLVIKLNEERATQALTIEREKVARKKCGRLEEEIKHLQMSKRVTETIEQHEKNPKSNVQDSETSKVITDTSNSVQIPEQNKQPNSSGPSPQRLPCYDGKTEWKPYYMQFIHFSNRYKWDSKQRLDRLIECLRDKALKFYSTRPLSVQNDFVLLSEKLNQRFGNKDLPYTIRRQLQEVRQNIDETVEEFAERVQEMATDGYGPNTPENVVETISVDCVKSSIHNQRIVLGKRQEVVKRVHFDSDNDSETESSELAVRALNRYDRRSSTSYDRRQTPSSDWQSSVESRLKKTEQDIGRPPTTEIKQIVSVTGNAGTHNLVSNINKPGPFNSNLDVTRSTTITGCSGTCETSHFKNEEVPTVTSQFKVKEVSMYGDDTKYKPINLVLQITINGKQADAIVDTAAQVTVINFDFAKSLDPAIEVKEPVILKGAGKDNSITARYADRVAIKVGKTETRWRVIVADITDPVILGLDVLQHIKAVINLVDLTITVDGEKLTAAAKLSGDCENDIIVQPTTNLKGLLMPNILSTAEHQVPVSLRNVTDKYITLKKNCNIGTAMEVAEVSEEAEDCPTLTVRKLEQLDSGKDILSCIPEHLQDMFMKSKKNLSFDQSRELAKLAQRSWGQFETDIDDVIPLAVRKVAETDVNNAQTDHCNWMEGRSPRDIIAEQEKDSDLCQIIQWLKNDQVPSEFELQLCSPAAKHWWSCNSQLKFKDGVLVYEWLDTVPPKLLVMVPKSMKQEVLVNCHNTKLAGHFGQQKTYNKLKSRFMWHGMRQDALIHVGTCEENIQSAQFRQKRDYDTKLFQRTYDVGDAVYRIDSATKVGESKKLRSPWQGPYLVIKVISPVLYRIQKRKKALVVHHDKLKPCEDRVLPKWLKYAKHRLSLGVPQENEDLDIMIQDPDIGHDLSVLFPDEIPDNDLTMICSGSSGNYGQIINGSPVQDVDMNNQVMDTPGSMHSPVAKAISSCPFCVTGSAGKKECEHHYRVVSDLNDSFSENDLDETFLYGVEDSEENEYVGRTRNRPRYLDDYVTMYDD
ncbi:unnamed protein product [Mytilus edulis]|uniref:Integrase zinc-binding domain-containing protein n=1 Tax=Mytilus edulis TaxID=6550 RepID=A0A8S3PSL8_MYTED|nr:unnamed protein product [Mytilus edulis]